MSKGAGTDSVDLIRARRWDSLQDGIFDVVVAGAGINGSSIYHELCRRGYSVLLIDKGDFSGGTSQASAMMIWGGLLYLRNLDLRTVVKLSGARDEAIKSLTSHVNPVSFHYIPAAKGGRNRHHVQMALYFYWLLGGMRRKRPSVKKRFEGLGLLGDNSSALSLCYEEAVLRQSDSRFVLHWITPFFSDRNTPLNYCRLTGGEYEPTGKVWHLCLADELRDRTAVVKTRMVLNCTGVWTDEVNRLLSIDSPYKHVLSKGVFIGVRRPAEHEYPLIFEMAQEGDVLSFIPWGPVSLWGPTETKIERIDEGFAPDVEDIRFLLRHASLNLKTKITASEIVSLRCGIRPLAVKKSYKADCYPLDLSRKSVIVEDQMRPWVSVYGGKLTDCRSLAGRVAARIERKIAKIKGDEPESRPGTAVPDLSSFPGLNDPVSSIEWCMKNEFCCTIEDYLRRRTNIAQWVPREGMEKENGNAGHILGLLETLHGADREKAHSELAAYTAKVKVRFDDVIKRI